MKVKEFIKNYKIADKIRDGGINYIKEHMVKSYVPYIEKMSICQMLINSCWYRTDQNTGNRRLVVNSPNLRLIYLMSLVRQYTDIQLQFEGTKIVEDYDDLRRTGILGVILHQIPNSQIDQFNSVLQMAKQDLFKNEYEIGAYIRNRIDDAMMILKELVVPALESAGISIEDISVLLSSQELKDYVSAIRSQKEQ